MASITGLMNKYEEVLHLWDDVRLIDGWTEYERKKEAAERYQAAVKEINSPDTVFEIFKRFCFGGNEQYESLPELSILPKDLILSDNAKLASDGAFLLSARQVPARVMRGYNPVLKVHFIAIKGLHFDKKYRYESVQIICQSKLCPSIWISNGDSEVCPPVRANILKQFIGDGTEQELTEGSVGGGKQELVLGSFTREEYNNLMALKIFIDAPKIMEIAFAILSGKLLPHLSSLIIDYYSFEATVQKPLSITKG